MSLSQHSNTTVRCALFTFVMHIST